jgi:bacillithiol synthase
MRGFFAYLNMQIHQIDFKDTGYFSKIILDYLQEKDSIKPYYKYAPEIDNFANIIKDKSREKINRKVLVDVLKKQYESISDKEKTIKNIESLLNENTYTVTTGHQLNIFTGPLYFIYKIVNAINLAKAIEEKNPDTKVVPVYWMASEDHDFAEINHIHLFNKRIEWNIETQGPTGKIKTESIKPIIDEVKTILGESDKTKELISIFENAYLKNVHLVDATRALVHELFKDYGLVIIDADHKELKKEFSSIIKQDILDQNSFKITTQTNKELAKTYDIQVNPREINFFYIEDNYRERLVFTGDKYQTTDERFSFTQPELLSEIENHPEKFSPNVVMRPLYEEKILPNLAYIGGPGELAYWFQLKNNFEHYQINFPMLVLRTCVLIIDEVSAKRMEKFHLQPQQIFEPLEKLTKEFIKSQADTEFNLQTEIDEISKVYHSVIERSIKVDASLKPSIEAEKTKTINALNGLEQRLLKAEKKKFETEINQLQKLKEKLFPNNGLQERYENLCAIYLRHNNCIDILAKSTASLAKKMYILFEKAS